MNMLKCQECNNNAELTCLCDLSLRFCNVHLVKHQNSLGNHKALLIEDEGNNSTNFCLGLLRELDKRRAEIFCISNSMISNISKITKSFIKKIDEEQLEIKKIIRAKDFASLRSMKTSSTNLKDIQDLENINDYLINSLDQVSSGIDYRVIVSQMSLAQKYTYFSELGLKIHFETFQINEIKVSQDNK